MITDKQVEAALYEFFSIPKGNELPSARSSVVRANMRAALEAAERAAWRPIETAPAVSINRSPGLTKHPVLTTETIWVRDADGRVYEAWFVDATDEMGRTYWGDLDGDDVSDPVEWMPHPLWTPETDTRPDIDPLRETF